MPWYYRWAFTNWLIAKPWEIYPLWKSGWHYEAIYSALRSDDNLNLFTPRGGNHSRPKALWYTITFPHVHHISEE